MVELDQSARVFQRGEIVAAACALITSSTELANDAIDLVVRSERDTVRTRATQLGFETKPSPGTRIDTFQLPTRSVSVRYDDYGAVVEIVASDQVAEFEPTRDGAFGALTYEAGVPKRSFL